MTALQSGRRDLRQHLEVETPEHVTLDYEIAGLGSRAAAALLDFLILGGLALAVALLLVLLARAGISPGRLGSAVLVMIGFAAWYGYFTFFEGLRRGQTPGKRALGLRVVADTGHAVTLGAAAVRNLLRLADFLPPPYLAGAVLVALHPRAKRIGDLVAGTVVVRDHPEERPARAAPPAGTDALAAPALSEEEFRLLSGFAARAGDLPADARARLGASLAARLASALGEGGGPSSDDPVEALLALHASETERRRGTLASRGAAVGGLAEQLAARQRERWDEFDALASRASARGLEALAPAELPDFAARYREIAADLARLRTYHAAPELVRRVERLVAAGHNALYRGDGRGLGKIWRVVAQECPGAVIAARAYVLAAFLAFIVPGVIGFRLLRERPEIAAEVLPDVLLERAEVGAGRVASGQGFVEVETGARPLAASGIIANNVRVAFYCFAGGAFLGVGSLFLLAFNGLQLGATAGHFTNVGLLAYLAQFIVGHGALELFAIWVAGAAGLLLGTTIIAPGTLARGDALVLAGRRAIRMVGAAVTCLVVAGLIEGFVSTSELGWAGRAAASVVSLLFLAAYLAAGALHELRGRRAY
ncbi:MAG: stage II sporulation protein M [Gemmatimonadota bacterium]